jgi:chemotaxis protein MotB
VNEGKYSLLSESLIGAFGSKAMAPAAPPLPPPAPLLPPPLPRKLPQPSLQRELPPPLVKRVDPQGGRREQMRGIARDILGVLDALVRDGQVKVTQSNRGISVEINASVLFASGQAQLRADSGRALQQVARVLGTTPHSIAVEGYTDDDPISTSQFPSNWELSAARASSVVRLFIDNGVAEARLSAVGYGPNRPVMPNDTPEGRARNRRVTVMILAETPGEVIDIPIEGGAPAR